LRILELREGATEGEVKAAYQRDREPPPQRAEHRDRDWIAANVGKVRYDSLRILELREGATEGEVKAAYQAMSRIYHPDKHNSGFTGMSDEE